MVSRIAVDVAHKAVLYNKGDTKPTDYRGMAIQIKMPHIAKGYIPKGRKLAQLTFLWNIPQETEGLWIKWYYEIAAKAHSAIL